MFEPETSEALELVDGEASGEKPESHRLSRADLGARARTFNPRRTSKTQLRVLALENPTPEDVARPVTRADCCEGGSNAERPCPWVSCKWHLAIDVNSDTGALKENFPDREIDELQETCALDVADRGGATLNDVGELMNVTRERIRQLEARGMKRVSFELKKLAREHDILGDGKNQNRLERIADDEEDDDFDPSTVVLPEVDHEAQLAAARAAGLARGPAAGALVTLTAEQLEEVRVGRYKTRPLPSPRRAGERRCVQCGESFTGTRRQIYCSKTCAAAGALERARERAPTKHAPTTSPAPPPLAPAPAVKLTLERVSGPPIEMCISPSPILAVAETVESNVSNEGEPMPTERDATCESCTRDFKASPFGPLPKRCPECKGGDAKASQAPRSNGNGNGKHKRAAHRDDVDVDVDVAPLVRPSSQVLEVVEPPLFEVRIGRLDIKVRSPEALDHLIQRWGGGTPS